MQKIKNFIQAVFMFTAFAVMLADGKARKEFKEDLAFIEDK